MSRLEWFAEKCFSNKLSHYMQWQARVSEWVSVRGRKATRLDVLLTQTFSSPSQRTTATTTMMMCLIVNENVPFVAVSLARWHALLVPNAIKTTTKTTAHDDDAKRWGEGKKSLWVYLSLFLVSRFMLFGFHNESLYDFT